MHTNSGIYDVNVVDAENARVGVLVTGSIIGEENDIAMICVRVNDILGATYIICSVIYPHDVVSIHAFFLEKDTVEICGGVGLGRAYSRGTEGISVSIQL